MAYAFEGNRTTPAERLRELLDRCEIRIVSPDEGEGVAELFRWMDDIAALWPDLASSGADLRGEQTRWESLQSRVRRRGHKLLKAWQGRLKSARQTRDPDRSLWWWWLDDVLAQAGRRRLRRALTTSAIVVAIVVVLAVILARLFPVDPVVQEVQRLQFIVSDALQAGDLETARESLEQAVALDPASASLHLELGALADLMGDAGAAQASWETAHSLLPNEADFLTQRGRAYLLVGATEKALADEESAVTLDPNAPLTYFYLGNAYEGLSRYEQALTAYEKASELALDSDAEIVVLARTRMANLLQTQGLP